MRSTVDHAGAAEPDPAVADEETGSGRIARVEREAEEVLAQLAQEASLSALRSSPVMASLSPAQRETIRSRLSHLSWDRSEEDADSTDQTHRLNAHDILVAAQTIAWTPPAAPDPESWTGCCGGWTCEPC
ncbi:hypothetical protein [Paenarthrobacter sp. TA1.8]|jgi:hypothetical protein|uniref:hypothetical protein n=1 Tax=Paenarthrobacter sp. TA1.8 TaxID=3400219 RepID=UPI003B43D29A